MIITIDGPTASGKSTIARSLAQRIHFFYLSSGILYRGLAYCLHKQRHYDEERLINPDPQDLQFCVDDTGIISYTCDDYGEHLFLHGVDITQELKTPEIDHYSSVVATVPMVRQAMNGLQKAIAKGSDVIVEGRDCGSVVFPQAPIKFFLTASVAVRGRRWQHDQKTKGMAFSEDDAIGQIEMRDARDAERTVAPLTVPDGAILVDNSAMTIEQTVDYMLSLIKKSGKLSSAPTS